jgi:hypothetical protein
MSLKDDGLSRSNRHSRAQIEKACCFLRKRAGLYFECVIRNLSWAAFYTLIATLLAQLQVPCESPLEARAPNDGASSGGWMLASFV